MDLISEILETDRLADEKIKNAHRDRSQLESQTQDEINRIKQEASDTVEAYRKKIDEQTRSELDKQLAQIDSNEKDKLDKLDGLYAQKHEQWENAICERIIANDR